MKVTRVPPEPQEPTFLIEVTEREAREIACGLFHASWNRGVTMEARDRFHELSKELHRLTWGARLREGAEAA